MNNESADSTRATAHAPIVVVTQSWSDGICFVDATRTDASAVVARTEVGAAPWGVTVHAPSNRIYAATAEGLAVVDLDRRTLIALVSYANQPDRIEYGEERPGGTGLVVTPDGERVYVAVTRSGENSVIEVFDVAQSRFIESVEVGLRPFDVQISPAGDEVYTIDHDSFTLHTIGLPDHTVRRAEVSPFGTEGGLMSHQKPHYAAVAPTGELLLPYQGKGLVTFDPRQQSYTTAPMTGDTHQHGVSLTRDGRLLVVGVGAIGGAKLGPSLTIRDTDGEEVLVELDKGHENVVEWISPVDGRAKALLTGGSTSRGPWNGLTIIDLDSLERYEVPVPGRPQGVALLSR
ncbi:YncE family protein [Micromonospora sp. CB01531]|uniref:YncE family protein n=1 Tax=Micromonospora sp. CB01531 TaxID=1718947 RepID=UPI00093E6291|nr:YncE family protein [Micromonospora sp. CB01531]OKI65574.1 hypothetical protein A6A27_24695 [Micromonospora sp. CB01531]